MDLKPIDKVKLAAAVGLLLITSSVGLYLFLEWSTASPPEVVPTTQAAVATPAAATGPSFSDVRRFVRFVRVDDTDHVAAMLAKDESLTKIKGTPDRATPLHLATSVAMAKLLLDNGAGHRTRTMAITPPHPCVGSLECVGSQAITNRSCQISSIQRRLRN